MSSSGNSVSADPLSVLKVLDHDLDVYFSKEEDYNNLRVSSSLNNIIGRVVSVEAPRPVGMNPDGSPKVVLNFELEILAKKDPIPQNNATLNYTRLRITAWNAEIERLKSSIKSNKVLFFENIYVSKCPELKRQYNNNKQFNLSCQEQTIIHDLKVLNNISEVITLDMSTLSVYDDIQSALSKTLDYSEIIGLNNVHLKFCFTPDAMGIKSAVISDGLVALRIKVLNFKEDVRFEQGQKLKLYGQFVMNDVNIYLKIKEMEHITILDAPKIPKSELMKSLESPKKKPRLDV
ncbi:hypothetical protein QAD02_005037 [Eretmocerus hayati]|uniref:Uncharacterized protein n=1 Tax=Eretmocerus hayati TaxID=131215 RepID=A0ACC2NRE2_9HYME|nr:hypothetical protein QAD02_005037 [Eretmocerus hayati]